MATSNGSIDKPTLVEMLQQAAELEHALCNQYLYAAFTLKSDGEPGPTASEASLAAQWEQQITRVALQEMYHLMLANNLLIAVGSPPNFARPNFPEPSTRYSEIDLPSVLAPFDLDTISRFMCWEAPEATGWWQSFCEECSRRAKAKYGLAVETPPPYDSIAQLYGIIQEALLQNPTWIDPANAPLQVTSALVPFQPTVNPVVNPQQAAAYIDDIITEGEGAPDWESHSHFAYFHQIVNELTDMANTDPYFASWPTVANPIYDPASAQQGTSLITDPVVQPIGQLFSDLYLVLVLMLARLFTPTDDMPGQRQDLATAAMALMWRVKPFGALLTRLPAGSAFPSLHAGPSFELPQPLVPLDGSADEAFTILYGKLLAVCQGLRIASVGDTTLGADAIAQLGTIAASLETMLPLLDPAGTGVRR